MTEIRLIDADDLKKAACVKFYTTPYYKHILDLIDNAPTVEINDKSSEIAQKSIELGRKLGRLEGKAERPQGEWIMNKTSVRGRNYTCTACEKVSRNKFHFCPNCGAYMVDEH